METWADVFGFLPRPMLAEFVPQIGHWHFTTKAQYFLHELGKITLGYLDIARSASWMNRNGPPIVKFSDYAHREINWPWYGFSELPPAQPIAGWEFPLADVPIPKNIINFKGIHIRFVFFQ
jgi:hypothetical protein